MIDEPKHRHSLGTAASETHVQQARRTGTNDMKSSARRLLSLREAAVYMSCSYWTVRDYVVSGVIPKVSLPAAFTQVKRHGQVFRVPAKGARLRRVLIDVRDLDVFIEQNKETT
jgi:hypothetical protein